MRKTKFVLIVSLLLFSVPVAPAQQQKIPVALESEYRIRRRAIDVVLPEYPEEAKAVGAQGLVIVAVHFERDGTYDGMKVAMSPHPSITDAVDASLRQWRVMPVNKTGDYRLQGELRFRFVIEGREYRVEILPDEEQRRTSPQYRRIDVGFRRSWSKQDWED
ncbi:MAG: Gram-negative bacterial TonB protein C-terminal [Acidobacteriota bacterium]|jgi:TonB family protein|nr:Gram-negative bacterial TonB protein C-terminal [Acidobacteriota bacterium]